MKKLLSALLFFFAAVPAAAQLTTVSGTIKDVNNLPFFPATIKMQIVTTAGSPVSGQPTVTVNNQAQCVSGGFGSAPCQVPFQGTVGPFQLAPGGTFTVNLQDNTLVTPAATQWLFTVNATGLPPPIGTGSQVCTAQVTISGASQIVTFGNCAALALSNLAGGAFGGTNSQTANYSAVAGDNGKLLVMNGASLTVTLPNPPISSTWTVSVLNLNSTPVTISPNGLNLNTSPASVVLFGQFTGLTVYTDGANYFTNPTYGSAVLLHTPVPALSQTLFINTGNFTIQDSGNFTDFLDNGNAGTLALGRTGAGHTLLGGWASAGTQTISGCSLTAAVGGTAAGKFASGTSGTCTVTITLPAVSGGTGWTCDAHDLTTAADANNVVQTAFTTTTATLSGTTVSGDVITWKCQGF